MKYLFIISMFCYTLAISCGKSFLDSPPQDRVAREAYTTSLNACEELLRGCYLQLSNAYGECASYYADLAADNIKTISGMDYFLNIYAWKMKATPETNTYFTGGEYNVNLLAYRFYGVIRNVNYVLEKTAELKNENTAQANQLTASALTIRAISHFLLVNLLAQPYNFTPQGTHPGIVYVTGSDWSQPVKGREPVADIYRYLREDLQQAAGILQPIRDSNTTVSRELAYAFLSRVFLYSGDYTAALESAKKALDGHPLLTVDQGYPDDMFRNLQLSRSESYFQLLPGTSEALKYRGGGSFPGVFFRQAIMFTATADITNALQSDTTDVRNKWVEQGVNGWNIIKFPAGAVPGVTPESSAYFMPVIRVSEVMLNAAEAAYNLQQTGIAQEYLNQIRLRAKPGATSVFPTGTALMDSIRMERHKELAFEGSRLFDLLRWKMPVVRTDPSVPEAATLPFPDNRAIAPIPQLDVSAPSVVQNPGY
ncbi:RagB/SusD family nutrient uptake outer membrane protein [Chitinophaga deserti]|uniref:RagB/SusD family nutrient uptake outer membrane protein n=1 Tax=Chitinophaga deserti TaxID=2164099 RepID=UPI0018E4EE08|nr:RagB/SusD family nutrient uptake outer membrane protein [Chitinophaga deserti]